MKMVRFRTARHPAGCWGRVDGPRVAVLAGEFFAGELEPTGETVSLGELTDYLSPVPPPPNLIAIGANYFDHCQECGTPPPTHPLMFLKATTSIIGHGQDLVLPRHHPDQVDFEAELAVVIGREAKAVSEREALNYVLGYTCANDVSARDVQLKIDAQWARGKSFDTFCPLGPWLVTDLGDLRELRIRSRLNGVLMQDQPLTGMTFSVAKIIAALSAGMTLLPGTVILTGTPAGVGMSRTPPRFLRPGDLIEIEIDGIGTLGNRVRAEA